MKPEHITAWALDEASAEERERLEAELRDDPKAKQTAEETKDFCKFLLAELRDDSLALTDEQRERLKVQPMGQLSQSPEATDASVSWKSGRRTQWRTGLVRLALAACVVLGAFWTWHSYPLKESANQTLVSHKEGFKVNLPRGTDASDPREPESLSRRLPETPVKATILHGPVMKSSGHNQLAQIPEAEFEPPQLPQTLGLKDVSATMTAGDVGEPKKIQDQTAYGLNFGGSTAPAPGKPVNELTLGRSALTISGGLAGSGGINQSGAGALNLNGVSTYTGATTVNGGTISGVPAPASGPMSETAAAMVSVGGVVMAPAADERRHLLGADAKPMDAAASGQSAPSPVAPTQPRTVLGKALEQQNGVDLMTSAVVTTKSGAAASYTVNLNTLVVPESPAAPVDAKVGLVIGSGSVVSTPASPPVVMNPQPDAYYFAYREGRESADRSRMEKLEEGEKMRGFRPQLDARSNSESYTPIIENELKDVAREPLSTFSIDVDTASYANVRRFLNQNTIPPPDAVRIEELVNYFPTAEEGPAHDAEEPFAVRVEMAPCPWQPVHRLARISIKGRELGNERKNSNLVFLVDVSGSMNEPNKLPLVQQSLRMLTEQLGEGDRVTVVVYAGSSGLVLPPTNGEKKSEILAAIEKLKAGGSTHGSAGIQLAYEQAVAGFIKEGVNRVILCTDGDFNVGVSSPDELEKLITKKAKSGVFLSVLGFGSGNLKDRTMETLADKGNGNYAYIDSLSEARKVLVEQMSGTLVTIAKDVKIQVEFNPAAVRSYRLIGYENRMLAKEDFNDDTKDAGEIGAGHSVVALYEVVPANLPPGAEPRPAVDTLKYQAPAVAPAQLADAAKSGETMTVKLRYKEPDGDLSKLIEVPVKDDGRTLTASSEEYKYSAAVAGFGLLLRDSAYQGTLSWETVRRLALDGKGTDKLGYRGEFLQLIDKARGIKGQ